MTCSPPADLSFDATTTTEWTHDDVLIQPDGANFSPTKGAATLTVQKSFKGNNGKK